MSLIIGRQVEKDGDSFAPRFQCDTCGKIFGKHEEGNVFWRNGELYVACPDTCDEEYFFNMSMSLSDFAGYLAIHTGVRSESLAYIEGKRVIMDELEEVGR